ncbi:hypothetical protein [Neisseria viridiae]|nr:hypothetical protein [Neisseria viridiae]
MPSETPSFPLLSATFRHSRLRGNDDLEITRNPKKTETEHTRFPLSRE